MANKWKNLSKAAKYKILAGTVVVTAAVVVPVAVTQASQNTNEAAVAIKSVTLAEEELAYGQPPSVLPLPVVGKEYEAGRLNKAQTTYYAGAPVGTKAMQIAYTFPSTDQKTLLTVIRPVKVVKGKDIVIDQTKDGSRPKTVSYMAAPEELPDPGQRTGYAKAAIYPELTTYKTEAPANAAYTLAFRFKAENPNAPDLVVVYGLWVAKIPEVSKEGQPVDAEYGTKVATFLQPQAIVGYKEPFVDLGLTTYTPASPVGANVSITWIYVPEDDSRPVIQLTQKVVVHKQTALVEEVQQEVTYKTSLEEIPGPELRQGYLAPELLLDKTTYVSTALPGTEGLQVAWKIANADKNLADIVYIAKITVKKLPDIIKYGLNLDLAAGTALQNVPLPAPIAGYDSPVIAIEDADSYSAASLPGSLVKVSYRFVSENPGLADLLYVRPVTVYEVATEILSVDEGFNFNWIKRPDPRDGYKNPELDTDRTNAGWSTANGKLEFAWFTFASDTPGQPSLLVRYKTEGKPVLDVIDLSDQSEQTIAVTYQTEPRKFSPPSLPGFALPSLDISRTTYKTTIVPKEDSVVAFLYVSTSTDHHDRVVIYPVVVVKQPDLFQEIAPVQVGYDTLASSIPAPVKDGYSGPAIDQTSNYAPRHEDGDAGKIVWRYFPNDPGLSDLLLAATVNVQEDK